MTTEQYSKLYDSKFIEQQVSNAHRAYGFASYKFVGGILKDSDKCNALCECSTCEGRIPVFNGYY